MSTPTTIASNGKGLRAWLLQDVPSSILQARCQRAYLSWLVFRRNPIAMSGLLIIVGLVVAAILAPWITATNGVEARLGERLLPPSTLHWFGTDELGRDLRDRIIWGSRITLYIVGLVGVIVVPVGLLVGTVAGYVGGGSALALMAYGVFAAKRRNLAVHGRMMSILMIALVLMTFLALFPGRLLHDVIFGG